MALRGEGRISPVEIDVRPLAIPMTFSPRFSYDHDLVNSLCVVDGARSVVDVLPLPPDASLRLRHDAQERSTRSSTQIEGNPLDAENARRAIAEAGTRRGTAAEQEVRNYWRAIDRVDESFIRACRSPRSSSGSCIGSSSCAARGGAAR